MSFLEYNHKRHWISKGKTVFVYGMLNPGKNNKYRSLYTVNNNESDSDSIRLGLNYYLKTECSVKPDWCMKGESDAATGRYIWTEIPLVNVTCTNVHEHADNYVPKL